MNERAVSEVLIAIITLLRNCSQDEKANWFEKKLKALDGSVVDEKERKQELSEIRKIIAGMGSFTDLALVPKIESGIDRDKARQMQWELADRLDEAIGALLE